MQSKAATVAQYMKELPADRREVIGAVRQTILKSLPKGYEEGMQYGMISYFVPHSIYPKGYHCDASQPLPFVCLASQKNYISLYMFCDYTDQQQKEWFCQAWTDAGKKLSMGKSCVRFKKLDDVPLNVVAQAVKRYPVKKFIQQYEKALQDAPPPKGKRAKKKSATKGVAAKKRTSTKKKASTRKKATVKKAQKTATKQRTKRGSRNTNSSS